MKVNEGKIEINPGFCKYSWGSFSGSMNCLGHTIARFSAVIRKNIEYLPRISFWHDVENEWQVLGFFWFIALRRLPVKFFKRIVHGDVQHEGSSKSFWRGKNQKKHRH